MFIVVQLAAHEDKQGLVLVAHRHIYHIFHSCDQHMSVSHQAEGPMKQYRYQIASPINGTKGGNNYSNSSTSQNGQNVIAHDSTLK